MLRISVGTKNRWLVAVASAVWLWAGPELAAQAPAVRGLCPAVSDYQTPYFLQTWTTVVSSRPADTGQSLDFGADDRIYGVFTAPQNSLVQLLLSRCSSTEVPRSRHLTFNDCELQVRTYCKGQSLDQLGVQQVLGKSNFRPPTLGLDHIEQRQGISRVQLDYALPVTLQENGKAAQYLVVNGEQRRWNQKQILDVLLFPDDSSATPQILVAATDRIHLLADLHGEPVKSFAYPGPTGQASLYRQLNTALALLDRHLLVITRLADGSTVSNTLPDKLPEGMRRSDIAFDPTGQAGIFLFHERRCRGESLSFYALRVKIEGGGGAAGGGSPFELIRRAFDVKLEDAAADCDARFMPRPIGTEASTFDVNVVYNKKGLKEWSHTRFRVLRDHYGGPLQPLARQGGGATEWPGKLSVQPVVQDDENLYVLYYDAGAGSDDPVNKLQVISLGT